MAHELAHYILHAEYIKQHKINTIHEWKKHILGDGQKIAPLETQAGIMAGFLLMPTRDLENKFITEKELLKKNPAMKGVVLKDEVMAPYLAKPISKCFDVSEESANNRLQNWLKNKK